MLTFKVEKYFKNEIEKILNERIYENLNLKKLIEYYFFDFSESFKSIYCQNEYENEKNKNFISKSQYNLPLEKIDNFKIGILSYENLFNNIILTREDLLKIIKEKCIWKNKPSFIIKDDNFYYLIVENDDLIVISPLFFIDTKKLKKAEKENFENCLGYYFYTDENYQLYNFYRKKQINDPLIFQKKAAYNEYLKTDNFNEFCSFFTKNKKLKRKLQFVFNIMTGYKFYLNNKHKLIKSFSENKDEQYMFIFDKKNNKEILLNKRCYNETLFLETSNFKFTPNIDFPNYLTFFNKETAKVSSSVYFKKFLSNIISTNRRKTHRRFLLKKPLFHTTNNCTGSRISCSFINGGNIPFGDFFKFKNYVWVVNLLCYINLLSFKNTYKNLPFYLIFCFDEASASKKREFKNWYLKIYYNSEYVNKPYIIKLHNDSENNITLTKKSSTLHKIELYYYDMLNVLKNQVSKIINKIDISQLENINLLYKNNFKNKYLLFYYTDNSEFFYLREHNDIICSYNSSKIKGPAELSFNIVGKNTIENIRYSFKIKDKYFSILERYLNEIKTKYSKNKKIQKDLSKFFFLYF